VFLPFGILFLFIEELFLNGEGLFKVHTWLSWVLRSSESVRAYYTWCLTAPRRSWCFGGSWWTLGDFGSLKKSLVYTVRDPPFRRWRTGTLSEHLSLGDSRGSNTLSECSNMD
jgi:hypothetical protein